VRGERGEREKSGGWGVERGGVGCRLKNEARKWIRALACSVVTQTAKADMG